MTINLIVITQLGEAICLSLDNSRREITSSTKRRLAMTIYIERVY
jgi:hypothetical protein